MIIAASICQCQKNVKSPANNTGSGQRPHPVAYKHVANLTQSGRKRTAWVSPGYQSVAAMNGDGGNNRRPRALSAPSAPDVGGIAAYTYGNECSNGDGGNISRTHIDGSIHDCCSHLINKV